MNAELIQQTVALWRNDPAKAAGRPTVKAVLDGSAAAIEAGAFSWRIGLPPALGGDNSAPSPTLLLLSALAGCAVVFIRDTLAPQLGVELQAVEATVQCATDLVGSSAWTECRLTCATSASICALRRRRARRQFAVCWPYGRNAAPSIWPSRSPWR